MIGRNKSSFAALAAMLSLPIDHNGSGLPRRVYVSRNGRYVPADWNGLRTYCVCVVPGANVRPFVIREGEAYPGKHEIVATFTARTVKNALRQFRAQNDGA